MQIYKTLPDLENRRQLGLWHKGLRCDYTAEDIDWDQSGRIRSDELKDRLARALSPVVMGEQAGLYSITRIIGLLGRESEVEAQLFLTTMAVDEARHLELFARYYGRLERDAMSIRGLPSSYLFQSEITSEEPMVWLTGSLVSEVLAKETLEEVRRVDVDPALTEACTRILEDETRHLGFNHVFLEDRFRQLYSGEERSADEAAGRLQEKIGLVLDKVPPILEALEDDIRGVGVDPFALMERVSTESRRRLDRSIESGRRKGMFSEGA
jgi:hypothetical protein